MTPCSTFVHELQENFHFHCSAKIHVDSSPNNVIYFFDVNF